MNNQIVNLPQEKIVNNIFLIRGKKVMLDKDLAELYEVETKTLNQSVKRNQQRFPEDFMFQLNEQEAKELQHVSSRSQIVTLKRGQNIKYLPFVFTEHGVAMLSSILKSPRAVQMNILIIRAFIRLREILASNRELALKVELLEKEEKNHAKHINTIYQILGKLMDTPLKNKGPIGFEK